MQTRYMEKRVLDPSSSEEGQPDRKRPALASVIVEALKVDSLQKLCSSLEPILRRVVSEEVERALAKLGPAKLNARVSPKRIEGRDGRNLQLQFRSKLSLPLFTGGKVEGEQGSAIHIVLIDGNTNHVVTSGPESSVKLDVVVLEGDFNNEDDDGWTQEEFDSHIVKEREGKRPLLTGELQVILKEGVGTLGELTFTDNSSWIRSRKFRLGLKVASGCCEGIRIREAKTDAFTVKDHRGELYKKHYPPALDDEVWRLEKIGKDGSFHKRLNKAGIHKVEDFLRLVVRDSQRLRNILGSGMSNKETRKRFQPSHQSISPTTTTATAFLRRIPAMEFSPLNRLPQDTLHQIFSHLTLREIIVSKCVCKCLNATLSSPAFLHLISTQQPPLSLLSLRPSHRTHSHSHNSNSSSHCALHVFDTVLNYWFRFPLSFLPFRSHYPITSSHGLLYLWAEGPTSASPQLGNNSKTLIVCNPLTRQFKLLPQLGSAWCKHGSVLVGSPNQVLVLTELAAIYFAGWTTSNNWLKFSSNLPSKPRSPILISDTILALCDVGSPWRSQWKLFRSTVKDLQFSQQWTRLEKHEWGDIFDIMKRPRLLAGKNDKVLMIGGLKSSYSLHSACSTILVLKLDLESLEWEEAGRMPPEMFRYFQDSSKFKVFGGGSRVCFSGKRVGRLALWEETECEKGEWRWISGVPGNSDGLYRGFVFEAQLNVVP